MKDYHEIVTEAGRQIDYCKKNILRSRIEFEDLPSHEPMRPRGSWINLRDNLNPLYRFLESRVGKSWNRTYSDLSKLNFNSMSGNHIRQHIHWYVEENAVMIDGKPYEPICSNSLYGIRHHINERQFWVDKHGILRKGWKKKELPPIKDQFTIVIYNKDTKTNQNAYILQDGSVLTTGPVKDYNTSSFADGYMPMNMSTKAIFRHKDTRGPWYLTKYKEINHDIHEYIIGPFQAIYDKSVLDMIKKLKSKRS